MRSTEAGKERLTANGTYSRREWELSRRMMEKLQTPERLTIKLLKTTYIELCYGVEYPDNILMPFNICHAFLDKAYPGSPGTFRDTAIRGTGVAFQSAWVGFDPRVPNDEVWVLNSRHPDDPRYNRIIKVSL